MHQTLYRKYRPATFSEVVGQEHITSVLKYEVASDKVSHAYLFCGSRGTGKTSCAKILAKAVNCLNPIDGNPCCKCEACRAIDENTATDVIEMDAASNNGVDYIRDIRSEVNFTPAMLKKKVYIIDEVHMLSTGAFNALLKTLEEPPAHVLFILATTELHKLPATIISRCQRFDFRRITIDNISDRLKYIASKENIDIDDTSCAQIAKQAQGGMRDAISLFELCASGGNKINEERIKDILGVSGYDRMHDTALAILNGDMQYLLKTVSDVVSSSKDITVFTSELMSFYRDMLVCKYSSNPTEYLDLTSGEYELLKDATNKFKLQTIIYQCGILDDAYESMVRSPQNKRITLEFAFLKMGDATLTKSYDAMSARIEVLEDKIASLSLGNIPTIKTEPKVEKVEEIKKVVTETKIEVPVKEEPATTSSEDEYILDVSNVIEKLSKINPGLTTYIKTSDVYVSKDKNKVTIVTSDNFFPTYVQMGNTERDLLSAFTLANLANNGAIIKVKFDPKQKKKVDFSEEFFTENT